MASALALFQDDEETRDFASELQDRTLACRVHHEKLGTRKALTREQLAQVADSFAADRRLLAGTKRLLDTSHPAFRAVMRVHAAATEFWQSMTVPFPEPGIRLLRRDQVAVFDQRMRGFQAELREAVAGLVRAYPQLQDLARDDLGSLFSEGDYPARVDDAFAITWDFPSFEPPSYLRRLHPQLYEQECVRIRSRFDEAVRLTEEAFLARLNGLVAHLADRLTGEEDGKPKVFRNSALVNLNAFFAEFRQLDIGSSAELQELVGRAQELVRGVRPDDLRTDADTRTTVASRLAQIQQAMDGLMVPKPRRAISLVAD
jgi:hypothetical protein